MATLLGAQVNSLQKHSHTQRMIIEHDRNWVNTYTAKIYKKALFWHGARTFPLPNILEANEMNIWNCQLLSGIEICKCDYTKHTTIESMDMQLYMYGSKMRN